MRINRVAGISSRPSAKRRVTKMEKVRRYVERLAKSLAKKST